MKKIAVWLAVIAFIIFVIDWGVVGSKLLDGNYDITVGAYIGLISIVIIFVCVIYIRVINKCPHCGKMIQFNGKYCPYCGVEIK